MNKLDFNINKFITACLESNKKLNEIKIINETSCNIEFIKFYISADWFIESKISADIDSIIEIFKNSTSAEFQKNNFIFVLSKYNPTKMKTEGVLGFRTLGIEH